MLVQLEGKQERYYERWLRYDTSGNGETGENGSELSEALRKTGLLLSGSSFVELEQAAGDSAEVTEKYAGPGNPEVFPGIKPAVGWDAQSNGAGGYGPNPVQPSARF